MPRPFKIVFLPLILAGCIQNQEVSEPNFCEVSGESFGVVGGEVLASGNVLSESTVIVRAGVGLCTGTLIGPNHILTAAHCVYDKDAKQNKKNGFVSFTNNYSCALDAYSRVSRKIVDVIYHEDYVNAPRKSWEEPEADIAILKFEGAIPEGFRVRSLPDKNFKIQEEGKFVMSGFGVTSENKKDSAGVLRFATSPTLNSRRYINVNSDRIISILDQNMVGLCPGDSGGALYVTSSDGILNLVGVASTGDCLGSSNYTKVQAHLDWLDEALKTLGNDL